MLSIIYVHWAMDEKRSKVMRRSIKELIESAPNEEILVADNGGNIEDSKLLLDLCENKNIAAYLRFRHNVHFAYARNQLLSMASQPYICIMDNDIIVQPGWWETCVNFLKRNPGCVATPLVSDKSHQGLKFWGEPIDGWQTNNLAGSSCFVMSREAFQKIGFFQLHNMSGSKYAREIAHKGYKMALTPFPLAIDVGEREGYDWRNPNYSATL